MSKNPEIATMTDLTPTNGRASFYNKAKVLETPTAHYLRSFGTVVCSIERNGKVHLFMDKADMSLTTSTHLKSFCYTYGADFDKVKGLKAEDAPKILIRA